MFQRSLCNRTKCVVCLLTVLALFVSPIGHALQAHNHSHAHASGQQTSSSAQNSQALFAAPQEYTCSMHPTFRSTDPNDRCPICGMELIPVASGGDDDGEVVRIEFSGRSLALLGLQTEPAQRGAATQDISLTGTLDYDERSLTTISAWTSGRIDRLYVNFTGAYVQQGEPLLELYSPELLVAQQDLLQAVQVARSQNPRQIQEQAELTLQAARSRLRLLGITTAQIDEIIVQGKISERVVIRAPSSGLVTGRMVSQGDYVATGEMLLQLADSDKMWLLLDVFERDLHYFQTGQTLTIEVSQPGHPRHAVQGEVVALAPRIDAQRRTREMRVALNESLSVQSAGGFVRASVQLEHADVLTIPVSAPLITGKRAVVYVQEEANSGAFAAREVELGRRLGDRYEVLSGLEAEELVVSRGAFRIDSELQLRGRPSMMSPSGGGAPVHDHGGAHGSTQGSEQGSDIGNANGNAHGNAHSAPAQTSDTAAATATIEFDASVDASSVFAAYHQMWAALHSDDLPAWQQAASDFHNAVAAVSWPSALAEQEAQLNTGAGHAHHVGRISVARDQFYDHSQAMIALAEAGYHHGELHLMFCPMARRGQGAYWLQEHDELLNPYFGSRMLRCGDHMGVLVGGNH
ncbi:MAG: efflux RND transporter periplasmic adaptor subunit [Aliidiomarina sp.]|uniref:efflux RND transporter periplasmic adaptor subunit n=1 Tax=Aliidiomarina sp. TaxID=1872439 RepID=UPI0025BE519F|nr:efflux RND transporter periplasmic adaptor subunit [Aliidiomarina sp.]MCH8501319.1 efflux RND transporter periplasmic adaptor subunit [Aliidiomarina sp.]